MFTHIALYVSFLLHLFITTAATTTPPFTPTDYILLDCGSLSNTSSPDGRDWQADLKSDYLPSNAETISITSQASTQDPSITQKVPYMTARIFKSQFNYTFSQLTTGPKFIRLYFYPSTYFDLNMKQDAFFSVVANNYILLSNFRAFLTDSSMHTSAVTLVKEYIIRINDDRQLNIIFKPSPNSYAFVNGIELVSIPDTLYYPGIDVAIKLVGETNTDFYIDNRTAFETAYRLNVGGRDVPVTEDTGMFRAWTPDDDYILGAAKGLTAHRDVTVNYTSDAPPYTGPEIVYTSARFMNPNFSLSYTMTWSFPVDSGFYYLLRLHFCEFFLEIREEFDRVFTIFINNRTAELEADVISWGHGPQVAVKRDYVAYVADPDGHQSKQDLWLEMHPNPTLSRYDNALLNGLEIFKLTQPNGNLNPSPYTPTDYILLDCGSSSNTSFPDGRDWQADLNSDYLPSNAETISITSQASTQDPSITQKVPYMTARNFQSQFTYTFSQLTTGPKFIRLYFYPSTYSIFNKADSFFSVIANSYTLLSNFSAHLTVSSMPSAPATLVKEYIIHINDDRQLNIIFKPSPNSYAFVNGIELVSIPDTLYYTGIDVAIKLVGETNIGFFIDNRTAFETAYRLNVGGRDVPVTEDTGMFRAWTQDDDYILGAAKGLTAHGDVTVNYTSDAPPYTAPKIVYNSARYMNSNFSLSYNMTWLFPDVDSGFYYLLRLHFCEFFLEIREESDRIFTIFINNRTAELEADVISWGHGPQMAVKRDYIAYVADPDGHQSKQDLWLEMHSNPTLSRYNNAFLNGLEIFKLTQRSGNLNPSPVSSPTTPEEKNESKSWPLILAVTGVVVLVISFVSFLIFRRRKKVKDSATSAAKSLGNRRFTKNSGPRSALSSDPCRHFSIEEIRCATSNFDDNYVIGVGGFGNVYKGYIDNGTTEVAIKRLNPSSNQGAREFLTEMEMLSKLRHLQLVSLVGYCDDKGEMILVYDYMSRGTLRDHLYKTENSPLPWKQRLKICIGAAKGLLYLHTSAKHTIIHRDIKSTNILLDENWVAKVSDFGLSKMGPIGGTHAHVSTMVKGSFGYLDPEYYRRQQLTEKSDVYSFGVVLFEVLCAKPAIDVNLPEEQVNLAEWVRHCYREGTLDQILDPNLKDEIAPESLDKYVDIALRCLKDKGIERPAMNDVVWNLEYALKLQEAAEKRGSTMNASDDIASSSSLLILQGEVEMVSRSGEASSSKSKSSDTFTISSGGFKSPEDVFTDIMNPSRR